MKRRRLFQIVIVGLALAALGGGVLIYRHLRPSGRELNQRAWKACYLERDQPVPADGPREGWWGSRVTPKVKEKDGLWFEPERDLAGVLEIDAQGVQRVSRAGSTRRILILGGSVAFGAYASNIAHTYFARLGELLAERGLKVEVCVLAAGDWVSALELRALEDRGLGLEPDLVVFLHGLNDLTTNRSNLARDRRVPRYLETAGGARDLLAQREIPVVFALQPFLPNKHVKSSLEERILEIAWTTSKDPEGAFLIEAYGQLRRGLERLVDGKTSFLVDCSGVFDDERATTFADLWHFADPGHELLARHLAQALAPILR